MPNLDEEIGYTLPFSYREDTFVAGTGVPYFVTPQTFSRVIEQGYYDFSLREFRESSDRNSRVHGERLKSPFKLRLMEWYSEKPIITQFLSARKMRRAFHLAKVDWRRRRPVKSPADVPYGWSYQTVDGKEYAKVQTGFDPVTKLSIFQRQPLKVTRLRPSNRVWRRKSPHVTLDARVNDLLYWKQTGSFEWGWQLGISNTQGMWLRNAPPPDGVDGTELGRIWIVGKDPIQDYMSVLGFTTSLLDLVPGTAVKAEDLETMYADEIDKLSDLALNRHYKKLQNQKIDLATETAQAMQTVNMIADLAKRAATALISLKKLDVVSAFKALFPTSRKELANDYLVYQYGIKPLLGDIVGAAEHLAEYVIRARPVKSNGHAQKTIVTEIIPPVDEWDGLRGKSVFCQSTVKIRVKYGSIFGISDDLARQAAQLGFTNPANVVWELVPFSFVADWFLPIGDFLSSLTALNGLSIRESYKTVFIEHTEYRLAGVGTDEFQPAPLTKSVIEEYPPYTIGAPHPISSSGYLFVIGGQMIQQVKTVYCKREVIPLPDVPLPRFKSPISLVHLEEALALITQLRGK